MTNVSVSLGSMQEHVDLAAFLLKEGASVK